MWINYGYFLIMIAVNEVAAKVYPLLSKYDHNIARHKRQFGFNDQYDESPDFERPENDVPNNDNPIFFDDDNIFSDIASSNNGRSNQNGVQNNPNFFDYDGLPANPPNSNGPTTQGPLGFTRLNIPGMGTTRSACEDRCLTTTQYNPVCGDNNVTYNNIDRFNCAVKCGRRVRILAYRACPRIMVK